jgi:jasmonate ZIM domain-containing protein
MDWSFASKPGAAPALMSFRSASFPQFSSFDGAKNPAPRILTHQVCAAALLGSGPCQLPSFY